MAKAFLGILISLLAAISHLGQSPQNVADDAASGSSQGQVTARGKNEFGVWGGFALKPVSAFAGITPAEAEGRKLVVIGLQYARTLAANKRAALQYTIDVLPLMVATNNVVGNPDQPINLSSRGTAYGFGLMPLGLRANFRNSSTVQPFVHIAAGGLLFNKPVPLPDAGKFAFALEGGGGLRFIRPNGRVFWIGARLHHISNGDRSGSNRGLNQVIFASGFSVSK